MESKCTKERIPFIAVCVFVCVPNADDVTCSLTVHATRHHPVSLNLIQSSSSDSSSKSCCRCLLSYKK